MIGGSGEGGPRSERGGAWIALAVLVVLSHLAGTLAWLEADGGFERPLSRDAAWRRLDVLDIHERMVDDGLRGWLRGGYYHDDPHPPLMPMVAAVAVYAGDGDASPRQLWWAHAFFAVCLAAGTWRLARNFGGPAFAFGSVALTLA